MGLDSLSLHIALHVTLMFFSFSIHFEKTQKANSYQLFSIETDEKEVALISSSFFYFLEDIVNIWGLT